MAEMIPFVAGEVFGRLTTVRELPKKGRRRVFLCRCDCGTQKAILAETLRSPKGTRSCGCLRSDVTTARNLKHGQCIVGTKQSLEYTAWQAMHQRCNNKNYAGWENYGGRGIKVCERWKDFDMFISDMGPHPGKGYSIDRIDNDGDYSPENCRWATKKEQARNSRKNRMLTFGGKTQCISAWAEETGIDGAAIRTRLSLGWSVGQSLTIPVNRGVKIKDRVKGRDGAEIAIGQIVKRRKAPLGDRQRELFPLEEDA